MRFIIPKGKEFECEFVVKEPGSSTPMDLTGYIGTFTLSTIGPEPILLIDSVGLTISDAINGVASVTLSAAQTANLTGRRGFAEDGFPMIATYRATLDLSGSEIISVEIPQVYITDDGA